jgi:hypothetical protein
MLINFVNGIKDSVDISNVYNIILNNDKILYQYISLLKIQINFFAFSNILLYLHSFITNFFIYYICYALLLCVIIPSYILSLILSIDNINSINTKYTLLYLVKKQSKHNFKYKLSTEIHNILILLSYILCINCIYFIPHIGTMLFMLCTSLQYGYYSFEYMYNHKNKLHFQRMNIIGNNICYFTGYGLFFGIISVLFNFSFSYLFIMISLPIYIINAYIKHYDISCLNNEHTNKHIFTIFTIPYLITELLLKIATKKYK